MRGLLVSALVLLAGMAGYAHAQGDQLVVLETGMGDLVIELFPDDAPNHVDNFVALAESGFYDGVIFHRIIPGFMIQGGDPNTISGDPSTWGIGGPDTQVDAEFNSIKHNRGIVSMARSSDPNSGGSQFFVVHQDSNFLDRQYTVFGRIVTEQSFETLDMIAAVETGSGDRPVDPEPVRITRVTVVDRSDVPDLLDPGDPDRIDSPVIMPPEDQKYESEEHDVSFMVPAGWFLQTPEKTDAGTPDVVAVGPKTGALNPIIYMIVRESGQETPDDLIDARTTQLDAVVEQGGLEIISADRTTVNGYDAYEINAEGTLPSDETVPINFRELMIFGEERYYTFVYTIDSEHFESHMPSFEEALDSFEILSLAAPDTDASEPPPDPDASDVQSDTPSGQENSGCLIATAAFGSELSPQVQRLREIRDGVILPTETGSSFMAGFNQFYYSFSPTVADWERQSPVFKESVRIAITPMLATLSVMEHAGSEREVLGLGAGVILMNVGMYIAAPVAAVLAIRRVCNHNQRPG